MSPLSSSGSDDFSTFPSLRHSSPIPKGGDLYLVQSDSNTVVTFVDEVHPGCAYLSTSKSEALRSDGSYQAGQMYRRHTSSGLGLELMPSSLLVATRHAMSCRRHTPTISGVKEASSSSSSSSTRLLHLEEPGIYLVILVFSRVLLVKRW